MTENQKGFCKEERVRGTAHTVGNWLAPGSGAGVGVASTTTASFPSPNDVVAPFRSRARLGGS